MPSPMLSVSQVLSHFVLQVTLLDRDCYPHFIENKTETLIFMTVQLLSQVSFERLVNQHSA